jgi:tetratricopeptide (TPR) repeat protein
MAKTSQNPKQDEVLVDIVEVRNKTQEFYHKYQNIINYGGAALLIIIVGLVAYNFLYKQPRQVEAIEQMAQAQRLFERDSFAVALENPGGGFSGFLGIIENYGGTQAANLAHYYAGVCYLNLGQIEAALSYMEDFSPKGTVLAVMKEGIIGDCHAELGDLKKAMKYYVSATEILDTDELMTPHYLKKVGMLHQLNGDNEEAIEAFQKILYDYPNSFEATDIEKYIGRLEAN